MAVGVGDWGDGGAGTPLAFKSARPYP